MNIDQLLHRKLALRRESFMAKVIHLNLQTIPLSFPPILFGDLELGGRGRGTKSYE